MNNELFNSVRKNTEMSFNKNIFDFFMNEYLEQDMSSYTTNDGENLFDFIKLNKENASPMNMDDYKELVNKVIERTKRLFMFSGKPYDKKDIVNKIVTSLNSRKGKLTFSSEELYGDKVNGDKDILLYFDVAGKDIISVLTRIIKEFDIARIGNEMENGHTDAIKIATSVEDYKRIVEILDIIKSDVSDKVKDNDYARSNWFGVNTVKDGKTADQVIGSSFIKALDTTLSEVSGTYPEVLIDGKSISDYLTGETNKDLARQTAYKKILEVDNTLGDKVYELVLLDMKELGLDPDNMYMFNTINDKLNSTYGTVEKEEQVGEKLDAFVSSLDDNQKNFDEILSQLELPTVDGQPAPTKEIPPIPEEALKNAPEVQHINVENVAPQIDAQVGIKEESVEVEPPHDIEPMSKEEEIVDNTMNKVGAEINKIIEDPKQPSVAKEIANLSPEEKVSMAKAIDDTQEALEIENKYLGLLDGIDDWTFDTKVKDVDGNPITLLEYLEKNNTLTKVPFNSLVTLLDGTTPDGKEVTGKKFVSKYVLDSLRLNESSPDSLGGLTLEEIMEKYIEKIELPEYGIIYPEGLTMPKKKDKDGLLKKLFKRG